ncbi:RNA polymerase sigma factor [Oerskovia paurometabola]|uniref:RNA polymerase sigma factor n=1 Tax=Oerskovia paurometabola TaxID=162170 RepID=UPI00341DE3D5
MTEADDALSAAWREHWARLLAMLVARYRRPDLAEDALADAFAAAARTWPEDGVPDSPAAWLRTAAGRRVLDRLRAEAVAVQKVPLMIVEARSAADASDAVPGPPDDGAHLPDERLRLVFSCCHPALSVEARTALTLRFVAGLPVADIARLFLVQDSTMAARLTRAKKRLVAAGIPFEVPPPERLGGRLDDVASVLYLTFTAGYAPGTGSDVLRVELAGEAIRLGRLLDELVPGHPVVRALLALMVLQHSRRDARTAADGSLVLLADQDRSRWHGEEIAAGLALLASVPDDVTGLADEYRLQASIAAAHAVAGRATDTDWGAIADLYADLEAATGSAMVRLARSVAVAEARGPLAALALIDEFEGIDEILRTNHRLPATRAELLSRADRPTEAAASFEEAVRRCGNAAEREHLTRRLVEVRAAARR